MLSFSYLIVQTKRFFMGKRHHFPSKSSLDLWRTANIFVGLFSSPQRSRLPSMKPIRDVLNVVKEHGVKIGQRLWMENGSVVDPSHFSIQVCCSQPVWHWSLTSIRRAFGTTRHWIVGWTGSGEILFSMIQDEHDGVIWLVDRFSDTRSSTQSLESSLFRTIRCTSVLDYEWCFLAYPKSQLLCSV